MTTRQQQGGLVVALVIAVIALVASVAMAVGSGLGNTGQWNLHSVDGRAPMGGMTGGAYAVPGDGEPVTSLEAATDRAQDFAGRLGLDVGEVMEFSNGYYAELLSADGEGATEVLIDPDSGAVGIEYGPAMMWNTEFGMHTGGGGGPADVSPAEAERLAQQWLDANRLGLTAGEAEAFPGYYTLHTLRSGDVEGMLSVNAVTGAVWPHTWHGDFVAMTEGAHA